VDKGLETKQNKRANEVTNCNFRCSPGRWWEWADVSVITFLGVMVLIKEEKLELLMSGWIVVAFLLVVNVRNVF
jgi:hypothetical protein